jgi:SAM-dependent methyltransferase
MTAVAPMPRHACLRAVDGCREARGDKWLHTATAADERALGHALPPVLDIGCGPGRHVVALAERGIPALGIDITPTAVAIALGQGALVLERSVFDRVPASGRWCSALLLDGNIGIGGDPERLLRRVVELLSARARVVIELSDRISGMSVSTVRLEFERNDAGPWFRWTRVSIDDLIEIAMDAALEIVDVWQSDDGRSFACLETSTRERA